MAQERVDTMITPKQRAYLRGLAQNLNAIFQIGKNGMNENQIKQIIDALEARELVKISLLDTVFENKNEIANELARQTQSDVVQVIGKKITLYKRSKENPRIELP